MAQAGIKPSFAAVEAGALPLGQRGGEQGASTDLPLLRPNTLPQSHQDDLGSCEGVGDSIMTPGQPVLALPNNARRLTGLPPEYHISGCCYDLTGEAGSDHPSPALRQDALPLGQQGGVGLCAGVGVPLFTGDRLERPVAVWQRVSLCKGIRPSDTLCLLLMTIW